MTNAGFVILTLHCTHCCLLFSIENVHSVLLTNNVCICMLLIVLNYNYQVKTRLNGNSIRSDTEYVQHLNTALSIAKKN